MDLHVHATDSECRNHKVAINGVPLEADDNGSTIRQALTFPHWSPGYPADAEIDAVFDIICITGHASLLSVQIVREGEPSGDAPGFTATFTQTGQPQITRLQPVPRLPPTRKDFKPACVVQPPEKKNLVIVPYENSPSDVSLGLQDELLKLDVLRSHFDDLKKEIQKQEATIMSIWKAEFSQCSNIKCYFQTALHKVPVLAHLIVEHVRHHSHIDASFFRNLTHRNCSRSNEQLLTQPDHSHDEVDSLENMPTIDVWDLEDEPAVTDDEPPITLSTPTQAAPSSKPTRDVAAEPESTEHDTEETHRPPFWTGGKPPWADGGRPPSARPGSSPPWGPPPWFKPGSAPPWAKPGSDPSRWGPPPWAKPGGRAPWMQDTSDAPMHKTSDSMVQPDSSVGTLSLPTLTSQQIFRIRLIGAMIGLLVVLLLGACLFACIKHKKRLFRDPRCRAEIMTRREEFLTKRAYRKAACKHKWRTLLARVRSVLRAEESEKEAMLVSQDDSIVVAGVDDLRAAHQFVEDVIKAEEGESDFVIRTRTRSESLPSYTSDPPGYSSGQEGEISVIDGFSGYTPSTTTNDDTADSSVVDCSPRMSFETQRTVISNT